MKKLEEMTLNEYLLFKNCRSPFSYMVEHFDRIIWTMDYMLIQTNKNINRLK
jgi:hypothetical protein